MVGVGAFILVCGSEIIFCLVLGPSFGLLVNEFVGEGKEGIVFV